MFLKLGVADAGSYSSSVKGNITNDLLNSKDYGYYNMNSNTGAGMALIKKLGGELPKAQTGKDVWDFFLPKSLEYANPYRSSSVGQWGNKIGNTAKKNVNEVVSDISTDFNPFNYTDVNSYLGGVMFGKENALVLDKAAYDYLGVGDERPKDDIPVIDATTQSKAYTIARNDLGSNREFIWKDPKTKITKRYTTRDKYEFPDKKTEENI